VKNLILISFLYLFVFEASAKKYVVEFKLPLTASEESKMTKQFKVFEKLYPVPLTHKLKKTYVIETGMPLETLKIQNSILRIEETFFIEAQNIIPHPKSLRPVKDSLFPYQWGVMNQEQIIIRNIDDLRNQKIFGKKGIDIGWTPEIFLEKFKQETIIAVLDSGIDLTHFELAGSLVKNSLECESNDKTIDQDNNGFPGDCDGWNFTAPLKSETAKTPTDDVGHGTHVAGIIAASSNNKGLIGVSDQLKILPVKVLLDGSEESIETGERLEISERIARGIYYAVSRGAHIINLSLGWPRSKDTTYLRDAVQFALKKNVIIVAAAGNNNSLEPLFPCAIEGVICVGALAVDGSWAGFSNYGGVVDVLAPGEGILSTYPLSIDPDLFNIQGYEIKNGTSQAAPFVAASMGVLRSLRPDLSSNQIKMLTLLNSREKPQGDKYASFGILKISNLLNSSENIKFFRPQLKLLRQLLFNLQNLNGSLTIPFFNEGVTLENVQVEVHSLSDSIEVSKPLINIDNVAPLEQRVLKFEYKLIKPHADSQVKLKIKVRIPGEDIQEYMTEIPLVRDIRNDPMVTDLKFKFQSGKLPVGIIKDSAVVPLIYTIQNAYPNGDNQYYMRRLIKEPKPGEVKGLEFTIFKKVDSTLSEFSKKMTIPNGIQLISLERRDINFDEKLDYVFQAIIQENDKKQIQYHFFNEEGSYLWGESLSVWTFKPSVSVIEDQTPVRYVKMNLPQIGQVAIPVYKTIGFLPESDQDSSTWTKPDYSRRDRLYFLIPEFEDNIIQLKTRVFNKPDWITQQAKELNLNFDERLDILDLLNQSQDDYRNGVVKVLFTSGIGIFRQIYSYSIQSLINFSKNKYVTEQVRLEGMNRGKYFDLNQSSLTLDGDMFFGFYDNLIMRLITHQSQEKLERKNYVYRHDKLSDSLINHLASYEHQNITTHFIQSKSRLILIRQEDNKNLVFKRSILRFSFLPGKLLSEIYYPIFSKVNDEKVPALYVDATDITGNRIYVLESLAEGLVAPIEFSIFIPNNCKALNPTLMNNENSFQYNMLCFDKEKDSWSLKSLSLL
jgi:cell wall-associated protease